MAYFDPFFSRRLNQFTRRPLPPPPPTAIGRGEANCGRRRRWRRPACEPVQPARKKWVKICQKIIDYCFVFSLSGVNRFMPHWFTYQCIYLPKAELNTPSADAGNESVGTYHIIISAAPAAVTAATARDRPRTRKKWVKICQQIISFICKTILGKSLRGRSRAVAAVAAAGVSTGSACAKKMGQNLPKNY